MRQLKRLAATVLIGFGLLPKVSDAAEQDISVNHWPHFLAADTRESFTASNAISIRYSESESLDQLKMKMDQGHTGYDSITPSHVLGAELIQKGQLQKLDKKLIPNLRNLSPAMMMRLQLIDPGNQYLVPFSFTGIILGYNETKIRALLHEELPTNKLELLFNPYYSDRLRSCGINLIDYPAEAFSMSLAYLGRNPLSTRAADTRKANEVLKVIRPNIAEFESETYLEDLAEGRICLTTGFTSGIILAIQEAEKAKKPYVIKSAIVPDQSPGYFTVLAIPADAPNPKGAAKWINHILDPDVSASLTKEVEIATGNTAAESRLPKEMSANPLLVLSSETYRKFYLPVPMPTEITQLQAKLWADLKAMRAP